MKTLGTITLTSEQLQIIQNTRAGVSLIRGAAGSGKTSTAVLRIKQLASFWLSRRKRDAIPKTVRMLVLTFNRTLKGYIEDLANSQLNDKEALALEVNTFARWARSISQNFQLVDEAEKDAEIARLASAVPLSGKFVADEVDYLLGRFTPDDLEKYVTCERVGRGAVPRLDRSLRRSLLDEVVTLYQEWKTRQGKGDWHDLAQSVIDSDADNPYDVIIADESQDFSAQQVRAIMKHAANPSSVTFVLDAAQRIYPRGFKWIEAGITIQSRDSFRLSTNHRNTIEICRFAVPLLNGLDVGDDGTLPNLDSCARRGQKPKVIKGLYSQQVTYAIDYIHKNVDLATESVAFLKPMGGGFFKTLREALDRNRLDYVDLTRRDEWPKGPENIAICTMNSAKGLEFDHIIILGLSNLVTPHDTNPDDNTHLNLRRLLAMAVTRARESIVLGYKPGEESGLIQYLDPSTYDGVDL